MLYACHFYINILEKTLTLLFYRYLLSETLFEKLLKQQDLYLNTLKHLNFQLIINSSKNN